MVYFSFAGIPFPLTGSFVLQGFLFSDGLFVLQGLFFFLTCLF